MWYKQILMDIKTPAVCISNGNIYRILDWKTSAVNLLLKIFQVTFTNAYMERLSAIVVNVPTTRNKTLGSYQEQ